MTLGPTLDGSTVRKRSIEPVERFKCEARCCCVAGNFVWLAELKGGVAVIDAQQGRRHVPEHVAVDETDQRVQFKCLALVFDEIWAGDMTGTVHIFNASARCWKCSVSIYGVERAAPITSLFFDSFSVFGGSETGRIVQWDPFTKQQTAVFVALAPVTVVTVALGFLVGGDRSGAVQLWHTQTGDLICAHTKDTSGVSSFLAELTTSTLWVGRRNGTISVYTVYAPVNFLERISVGEGAVTSMLSVSGKVFVTTHNRVVKVFAATTRAVLSSVTDAHSAFIYGAAKVYTAEIARMWTIGNDNFVYVWDIGGYFLPFQEPSKHGLYEQEVIINKARESLMVKNAQLCVSVAESSARVIDVKEELRLVKDEAHELRLRLHKAEDMLKEKDKEIALRVACISELENDRRKLQKDVVDLAASLDTSQREILLLRKDHQGAMLDASQARTELSAKIAEKANLEQQLSAQRTQKSHLEIRLCDKEGEVAQLKAENARLHNLLGQPSSSPTMEKEMNCKVLPQNDSSLRQEIEELRRRNQLLAASIASMEYTIRRNEEEARDMTALLNAFRRKTAEHVSDPYLSALLKLTMVRNPARFEVEGDEQAKAFFRERNGPFVEFLQSLRNQEPQAYEQLLNYLQHPKAGSEFGEVLDRLFSVAQKEGAGISNDDIVTLKKCLPVIIDSAKSANLANISCEGGERGGAKSGVNVQHESVGGTLANKPDFIVLGNSNRADGSSFGNVELEKAATGITKSVANADKTVGVCGNGGNTLFQQPQPRMEGMLETFQSVPAAPVADDSLNTFLRSINSSVNNVGAWGQIPVGSGDDAYLRQIRGTFEFIVQTRRDLVEQLALLLKRIVKARQVVDTLVTNAREVVSSVSRRLSGGVVGGNGRQHLGLLVANILEELHEFVSGIVGTHFTAAEKQRLGFGV